MTTFYISILIIFDLSLIWIAAILTFMWAENSPLFKTFDHIDKTAKGIDADINKNNEDIQKRWREMIENKAGIEYTQYPIFKHERVKYSSGLAQPCTKKAAPKRTKKSAKKTVKKPAKRTKN